MGATDGMRERRETIFWAVAFLLAAIWPVLVFAYPAAQDASNHLARAFILMHPDDPALSQHFEILWHAMPDLAWDLFALSLSQVVSLVTALKGFMLLGLVLPVIGMALINRQSAGRWTYMPLLGTPFLFHSGYAKGFLGFNVSIGLSLIGIAVWRAFSEKHWGRRLALGWLVSTLLFFAHLVAWGIYGLTVLGLKLADLHAAWKTRGSAALGPWLVGLVRDGTQALPPLVLMALTSLMSGRHTELVGEISEFHAPWRRFIEAWHMIDTGIWFPSVLVMAVVAPLLLSLLLWLRTLRFDMRMAWPIAVLLAVFFVLPNQIYATYYVVWRVALGATYLAIAAAVPSQPITSPLMRMSLAVTLAAVLALTGWQAYSISNASGERASFERLIARIPEGQTLFGIHSGLESDELEYDRIGLYHFATDAVRNNKVMAQSMFANPAQQPIRYREARFDNPRDNGRVFMDSLAANLEQQGISVVEHVKKFDWVVVHGPTPETDRTNVPLDGFALVGEDGQFRLYCQLSRGGDDGADAVCPDGELP